MNDVNDTIRMHRLTKESRTLEYKSAAKDGFHQIAKTVVAFANDIGGEIWIGIGDQGGVVGLEESVADRLSDDIPRSLFDMIQPMVPMELSERNMDGKLVLIVRVFSGPQKPYYIAREGIPKGIYVRVGSSVMRAKQMHLDELSLFQRHARHDETIVPEANFDDLDQRLLKKAYPSLNPQAMEHDGLIKFNLLSKKREMTTAGVLMFHPQPHRYVPEAYTNISFYKTDDVKHPYKSLDITGPLPVQLEETLVEIAKYAERDYKLKGGRLQANEWDVPERALREAMANALFHRKYNIPAATRVSYRKSRIEIFNPGNFPGPIDHTNLGDGTSYIRNLSLCRMARKLRLMEKRGTGIQIILQETGQKRLKSPLFIEGGDFVKVQFFTERLRDHDVEAKPWEQAQTLLQKHAAITSIQLAQHLEVSKVTALKWIEEWVREKLLIKKGNGPSSRYVAGSSS